MADGTRKPIGQVEIGDLVAAMDPYTGCMTQRMVLDLVSGEGGKSLVEIAVSEKISGADELSTLIATGNHPFWVSESRKWVSATKLSAGMLLRSNSGVLVEILKIRKWTESQAVHNLVVSGIHTYFVGLGANSVLVHNGPDDGVGEVVRDRGVRIVIYSNDHAPPHAHVHGGGKEIRIGQNGKPLPGDGELSKLQRQVVEDNIKTIRNAVRESMIRYRGC